MSEVSSAIKDGVTAMGEMSTEITKKMTELKKDGAELKEKDLLEMSFLMAKYSTTVETISNIQKGITDTLKSLAQKV